MLENIALDHLRIFVAAVDESSFSAAGRHLGRSQPAISEAIAGLEAQLGIGLFIRDGRRPRLTKAGEALLPDARDVIAKVDLLKARAKGMAAGTEAELAVVADVFFPLAVIAAAAEGLREAFPTTSLRLRVEALGAALEPVLQAEADLGVVGPAPVLPARIMAEPLAEVPVVMVAAPKHPLAAIQRPIKRDELDRHVQLVLTDRSTLSAGRDFAVWSPTTWRLADLFAKHALLINGVGWGGMPLHVVQDDIEAGRLARLEIADEPAAGISLPMKAVYRAADPPGPAGRWFIERLQTPISGSPPTRA